MNAIIELSIPWKKFNRYADIICVEPGGILSVAVHTTHHKIKEVKTSKSAANNANLKLDNNHSIYNIDKVVTQKLWNHNISLTLSHIGFNPFSNRCFPDMIEISL